MISKQVYVLLKLTGGGHTDIIAMFTDYRQLQRYKNKNLSVWDKTRVDQKTMYYNPRDF